MKHGRRKVALLMHTATEWTRQVLRGVATYAHKQGTWEYILEPRGYYEKLCLSSHWSYDGVITRLTHPKIEQAIASMGIPAVNISWLGTHSSRVVKVNSDEKVCASLAAEHLIQKGLSCLGYFGPAENLGYGTITEDVLDEIAGSHEMQFDVFVPPGRTGASRLPRPRNKLKHWLASQPTPIGIIAWDSIAGYELSIACNSLGLQIPGEVSIICIEHDSLAASLASQPLSCIDQDPTRVGYEAARQLESLMDGHSVPEAPALVPPNGYRQTIFGHTLCR